MTAPAPTKMPYLKVYREPCRACQGLGFIDRVEGDGLRQLRRAAGVSLREAARRFVRSAAYLSDVELGRRRATESIVGSYVAEFQAKADARWRRLAGKGEK